MMTHQAHRTCLDVQVLYAMFYPQTAQNRLLENNMSLNA